MTRGSFATGYDQIPCRVWYCPAHGEVSSGNVYLVQFVDRNDGRRDLWWEHWCGVRVTRRTRKVSEPSFLPSGTQS